MSLNYISKQDRCGLEVGDYVLVYRDCPRYYRGWNGISINEIFINRVGFISDRCLDYGFYVIFDNDDGDYFPYFCLKKVHPLYLQSKKIKKFETVVRRQERKALRRLTMA